MGADWVGSPNYNRGNSGRLYLFPHWTCGGFAGSVSTLQNPSRQASAHYVIEGSEVAQLVSEDDTAWHCGNSWYNWRSISYELVGWPGNPPSRETLDTCAAMMADASRRYFGGAELVLGGNVMLHKMVSATSCPGETDIGYLVAKANELLGQGGAPEPAEPDRPQGASGSFQGGTYVCQVDSLNVRSAPSTAGAVVASYERGQTVNLDSWHTVADGYVWGRYTAYSGATRYIAVGRHTGKPESDDYLVLAGSSPSPSPAPAPSGIAARGYTVVCDSLNVRSAPSTSADMVASYSRGQTVNLDGWCGAADGYRWGRYTAYSGATRYIALGTADGSQTYLQ